MTPDKPWYKSKGFLVAGAAGLVLVGGTLLGNSSTSQQSTVSQSASAAAALPTVHLLGETKAPTSTPSQIQTHTETEHLSNDHYYTNVSGNTVYSPTYTTDSSVPAGASAQCRDGTYSFSQHRSGTCSHHGGVARWL